MKRAEFAQTQTRCKRNQEHKPEPMINSSSDQARALIRSQNLWLVLNLFRQLNILTRINGKILMQDCISERTREHRMNAPNSRRCIARAQFFNIERLNSLTG